MSAKGRRHLRWFRERWEPLGYRADFARSGHIKVHGPDGEYVTTLSASPRNGRSAEYEGERDLRRHHEQMQENEK